MTAAFDAAASSPLLEPASRAARDDHADPGAGHHRPGQVTTVPATTQPDSPVVSPPAPDLDTFGQGWVSDQKAWARLALWGTILTAIAVGAWLLGKRIPQWAAALIGIVPFTVVLYFFFDNVNRLLPANL